MTKKNTASFGSFQISSSAETTLDESLEMYEERAGSSDDGEKVRLLSKLDSGKNKTVKNGSSNNEYDEEMGRKFKIVGGAADNADFVTSA